MPIKTEALVIKVMDVGESDRLLTLLTKDYGIIKAFASGAKKLKSKYYAATSALCYSDFTLREVKDSFRVSDAFLKHNFFKIGSDVKMLSLGQYFCEAAEVLSPPDQDSHDMLRLLLNCFYHINSERIFTPLLKSIFELRALSVSGYMPNLLLCDNCGCFNENEMYFYSDDGILHCKNCVTENDGGIYLDSTLISAMRHIVYSDFEKVFSFSIPDEKAKRLSKITEKFLISQTERKFKTLDFYYSLD